MNTKSDITPNPADGLTQIIESFRAVKSLPTFGDLVMQVGILLATRDGFSTAIDIDGPEEEENTYAQLFIAKDEGVYERLQHLMNWSEKRVEIFNSLLHQITEAMGVCHMAGWDVVGALSHMNRRQTADLERFMGAHSGIDGKIGKYLDVAGATIYIKTFYKTAGAALYEVRSGVEGTSSARQFHVEGEIDTDNLLPMSGEDSPEETIMRAIDDMQWANNKNFLFHYNHMVADKAPKLVPFDMFPRHPSKSIFNKLIVLQDKLVVDSPWADKNSGHIVKIVSMSGDGVGYQGRRVSGSLPVQDFLIHYRPAPEFKPARDKERPGADLVTCDSEWRSKENADISRLVAGTKEYTSGVSEGIIEVSYTERMLGDPQVSGLEKALMEDFLEEFELSPPRTLKTHPNWEFTQTPPKHPDSTNAAALSQQLKALVRSQQAVNGYKAPPMEQELIERLLTCVATLSSNGPQLLEVWQDIQDAGYKGGTYIQERYLDGYLTQQA